MLNMDDYELFVSFIERSLTAVDANYFNTQFDGFYSFKDSISHLGVFRGEKFIRYTERGFAYELYHQLRKIIDEYRTGNRFFDGYLLQGEIKKMNAEKILEIFNYKLDTSYIPDLLFHIPSQDYNAFVVEIKAQPELKDIEILYDLEKLSKFLRGVNYRRSVFLTVNISAPLIEGAIVRNRQVITEMFSDRLKDCNIIVKEYYNAIPVYNKRLSQILP